MAWIMPMGMTYKNAAWNKISNYDRHHGKRRGRTNDQSKYESPDWKVGVPNFNRNNAKDKHRQEDKAVPPLRHLGVFGHQTSVDIRLFIHRTARLDPDLFAEEKESMGEGGGDRGKRQTVRKGECSGQEEGTISLVRL